MSMAISDESFFNIKGKEISRGMLVQQMIDYYNQKIEVGETKLTDFNEGSEIRNILESVSVNTYTLMEDNYEASKIGFVPTAYGQWLDLHGANPLLQLPRDEGSEAVGFVKFSIPEAITEDTVIPSGTILVSTENDLYYLTDEECVITASNTEITCPITCGTVGVDGDCSANTITLIEDMNIDGSVSVTNENAVIGGRDYEDDDTYRQRLLDYQQKDDFGSLPYYMSLGESVDGVHDVLLIDDTTNTPPYTKIVLVNGDVKPVTDETLMLVLAEFTDTNNKVVSHNFMVQGVGYTTVNMTLNLAVDVEIETTKINNLLTCFFNGGTTTENYTFEGFSIEEDLSLPTLYSALETFNEITNVSATVNTSTAGTGKVLKLGTVTINQTVNS